jgi:hypothetical protein
MRLRQYFLNHQRVDVDHTVLNQAQRSAELMQQLRFDTALAFDPAILRLTASASKYDLSFGSDFPFIPDEMILRVAKTYTELIKNAQPAKTDRA